MLPEIKPFDRQVTLVGDSGIQFMDFGLTLGREQAGEFVELASGVLTRLLYNEDKDFHFFVQFCDSFAECTSRSMYRFLSQEAGIPEIRITQEFVIFLRDEIVPVSSGVFHEETRQRSGQKRGVQKRGTAPLGAVILSFLSVP